MSQKFLTVSNVRLLFRSLKIDRLGLSNEVCKNTAAGATHMSLMEIGAMENILMT